MHLPHQANPWRVYHSLSVVNSFYAPEAELPHWNFIDDHYTYIYVLRNINVYAASLTVDMRRRTESLN